MPHALILPMVAHVTLAGLLFTLLTIARAPAIWGIGRRGDGSNPWASVEPRIRTTGSQNNGVRLSFCNELQAMPARDLVQINQQVAAAADW